MMTGHPGLFAGGDMVPAERSIDGRDRTREEGRPPHRRVTYAGAAYAARPRGAPADFFDRLNTWYYSDAPADGAARSWTLCAGAPRSTRSRAASPTDNALFEARRCLSCGNCFECDNCYGVCPDNAVIKLGPGKRFRIDLDFCKGCGLCAKECPCGAIDMASEET